MEKLFAMVDAEKAHAPRQRSFDLAARMSEFLSSFTPRTLAWSAAAATVLIMLQAAVIAAVMLKRDNGPNTYGVANAPSEGTFAVVRFVPQATFAEINNFLTTHRATVVEGPVKAGSMYRIRLSESPLPAGELNKVIQQMQADTRIIGFAAQAAAPQQ
jgi:hypothetical protein